MRCELLIVACITQRCVGHVGRLLFGSRETFDFAYHGTSAMRAMLLLSREGIRSLAFTYSIDDGLVPGG